MAPKLRKVHYALNKVIVKHGLYEGSILLRTVVAVKKKKRAIKNFAAMLYKLQAYLLQEFSATPGSGVPQEYL